MIRYKDFLLEVLTPEQKKEVDQWNAPQHSFSDHMFGGDPNAMRATFDLIDPATESTAKKDVEKYLASIGMKVSDYIKGEAIDSHGRPRSIGSLIAKAPNELKDDFDNDPSRQQQTGAGNQRVIISRHPHDVAGMTSEGHSWPSSCMNFTKGMNRHYLPHDVEQGTHVAYLVDKNDTDIQNPYARIAIKPFIETETGEKILRPESRTYGSASDKFTHTVNRIIEEHFPGTGFIYKKHRLVYNDDANDGIVADVDKALQSTDPSIRVKGAENPRATEDQLRTAFNDQQLGGEHVRRAAIENPNLPEDIMDKIVDDHLSGDPSSQSFSKLTDVRRLLGNRRISKNALTRIYSKSPDPSLRFEAVKHPRATKEIVNAAYQSGEYNQQIAAAIHKKLSKENWEDLINKTVAAGNEPNPEVDDSAAMIAQNALDHNPKVTSYHLKRLLDANYPDLTYRIVSHKAFNDSLVPKVLENPRSSYILSTLAGNKNLSKDSLIKMAEHESTHAGNVYYSTIIAHPNADSDVQEKILNKGLHVGSPNMKEAMRTYGKGNALSRMIKDGYTEPSMLIINPNINEKHLTEIIKYYHDNMGTPKNSREAFEAAKTALDHPLANETHIDLGLNSDDSDIRAAAAQSRNATPKNLLKALDDPNPLVRIHAAANKNLDREGIEKVISSPRHDSLIRGAALTNPNATSDQLHRGIDDVEKNDNINMAYAIANNRSADISHLTRLFKKFPDDNNMASLAYGHPQFKGKLLDEAANNPHLKYGPAVALLSNPNITTEHVDKIATSETLAPETRKLAVNHSLLSSQARMDVINGGFREANPRLALAMAAINSIHAGPEHISRALEHDSLIDNAIAHPKFNADHMHEIIDHSMEPNNWRGIDYHYTLRGRQAYQKMNESHIDKLFNHPSPSFRKLGIDHSYATGIQPRVDQIHKLINDDDEDVRDESIKTFHSYLTPEHLSSIIKKGSAGLSGYAMDIVDGHPRLTSSHINEIIDSGDSEWMVGIGSHPNLSSDHIHKLIDNGIGSATINHKNFDSSHLSKILDSADDKQDGMKGIANKTAAIAVLKNRVKDDIVNDDHLTKAIKLNDLRMNTVVSEHPKANPDHLRELANWASTFPTVKSDHPDAHRAPSQILRNVISHKNVPKDIIDGALNSNDDDLKRLTLDKAKANSLTPEQITTALNDKNRLVRYSAIRRNDVTPEHITKALDDPHLDIRATAASKTNLTPEHITKALNDEDDEVTRRLFQDARDYTSDHIMHIIKHKPKYVGYSDIKYSPNITDDHISAALDSKDMDSSSMADMIQRRKSLPREIFEKAINHGSAEVRHTATRKFGSENLTPDHISKLIKDDNLNVAQLALRSKNVTEKHITDALNMKRDDDPYGLLHTTVMQHPNATEKNLLHSLQVVRRADGASAGLEVQHPNATPKVVSAALDHPNPEVRKAAIRYGRDNLRPHHISKILSDDADKFSNSDKQDVLNHSSTTAEHVIQALNDNSHSVVHAAINSRKAPADIIERAMNHENPIARDIGSQMAQHRKFKEAQMKKPIDESAGMAVRDLAYYEAQKATEAARRRLAAREALLAKRLASAQRKQQAAMYVSSPTVAAQEVVAEGKAGKFADVIIEKARKQMKAERKTKINLKPELNINMRTGSAPEQLGSDQAAEDSTEPNVKTGL